MQHLKKIYSIIHTYIYIYFFKTWFIKISTPKKEAYIKIIPNFTRNVPSVQIYRTC